MIQNIVIFGEKLYGTDSYINFGFYNAFVEKYETVLWVNSKNLDEIKNLTENTLYIVNTKENNEYIPINKKNYYVLIKANDKLFRKIDKQKVFIQEYSTDINLDRFEKISDYVYSYKRKRTLVMPYGTILTPFQIIENLENFVEFENRENKIVITRNYNNLILDEVINTKSKELIIKKFITLDDEVDLIKNISLSCCYTNDKNKLDSKLLTHISYGTFCVTNSILMHELLDRKTLYIENGTNLMDVKDNFINNMKKEDLFSMIENILNNHTFENCIKNIFNYFQI